MTSSQITEKIIENLRSSQTDGIKFDPLKAPMLRQKLFDVSPAKYAALDWKAINHNSQHAMMWGIKSSTTQEENSQVSANDLLTSGSVKSTDVVKIYDEWVNKAKALDGSDDSLKKLVVDKSRSYVKAGQEAALESE